MKTLLVSVLCLSLSACANARPSPYAVRLDFDGGVCSGTRVGAQIILTAKHCFVGTTLVAINGQPASVLAISESGEDHVLVKVTQRVRRWARFGLSMRVGDHVSWTGNPAGMNMVYREGVVVSMSDNDIQLQAPVFGGDSGAGVFDKTGRVVGVVTGYRMFRDGNGHSFSTTWLYPLRLDKNNWKAVK